MYDDTADANGEAEGKGSHLSVEEISCSVYPVPIKGHPPIDMSTFKIQVAGAKGHSIVKVHLEGCVDDPNPLVPKGCQAFRITIDGYVPPDQPSGVPAEQPHEPKEDG